MPVAPCEGIPDAVQSDSSDSGDGQELFFKPASDIGSSFVKCSLFGDEKIPSEY